MALIQYINRVQFGAGALAELPAELALAGIARPLVVTDAGVVAAGLLARLLALPREYIRPVRTTTKPRPVSAQALGYLLVRASACVHVICGCTRAAARTRASRFMCTDARFNIARRMSLSNQWRCAAAAFRCRTTRRFRGRWACRGRRPSSRRWRAR